MVALIGFGETVEEWETDETLAHVLGYREVAGGVTVTATHLGSMEWLVVEDGENAVLFQGSDQAVARIRRGEQHIEEVVGLFAVLGYVGQLYPVLTSPAGQLCCVGFPDLLAPALDPLALFELGVKECRENDCCICATASARWT